MLDCKVKIELIAERQLKVQYFLPPHGNGGGNPALIANAKKTNIAWKAKGCPRQVKAVFKNPIWNKY